MLEAVIAIGDAEFCGGNAELAVLGGDADVRHHRDLYAAAEAESPDAGNGRLRIVRQQGALRGAAFGILFRGLRVVAEFFFSAAVFARRPRPTPPPPPPPAPRPRRPPPPRARHAP